MLLMVEKGIRGEICHTIYTESDEGYFLKVDVQYPEKLHELHNNCHF